MCNFHFFDAYFSNTKLAQERDAIRKRDRNLEKLELVAAFCYAPHHEKSKEEGANGVRDAENYDLIETLKGLLLLA